MRQSRPPTAAEDSWFDYADNLPFLSDEYLTRFADKLLGLTTAVLAAYIAGIKLLAVTLQLFHLLPLGLLLLTLFFALYSIYPKKVDEKFTDIGKLRSRYVLGLQRRRTMIGTAFVCYFLGVLLAVVVLLA